MSSPPSDFLAHLEQQAFEIRWEDSSVSALVAFRKLRGCCPCANCVNEMTGVRTYFEDDSPSDIHPQKLEMVGNYSVRITWSDGHHTGLFTWEYLREIYEHVLENKNSL